MKEIKNLGPDARRKIEILEARAIAHDKDRNYDEAVADLRAAIELTSKVGRISREKVQGLESRLQEAQESESKWNRLRDRDHVAVLDLPENIDEVKDLKRKCQWLKKNYRKMTVKWHPDRTKETTNEKRASATACLYVRADGVSRNLVRIPLWYGLRRSYGIRCRKIIRGAGRKIISLL